MPTSSNQSVPDARGYGWRTIHRRRSSRQSSSSLTPTHIPTIHRSRSCESYKNKNNNELTPDLAYQLFYGKYDPLWFSYIFDYLRPSESDRIELRSLCTFFRDILSRPKQMWTIFPCKKHATLDSLLESVQAVWEKNPLRAPTLVIVKDGPGRGQGRMVGEYVPFYRVVGQIVGQVYVHGYERIFRLGRIPPTYDLVRDGPEERADDVHVFEQLSQLGDILVDEGKLRAAEPLARRALKVSLRDIPGAGHNTENQQEETYQTSLHLAKVGLMLERLYKIEEAEALYRLSFDRSKRVYGLEDRGTLLASISLGMLLQEQGTKKAKREAEDFFRITLEVRTRLYGLEHEDTLISLGDLGWALHDQKKLDEAEPYLRCGLEVSERVFGMAHETTLNAVSKYTSLLQDQEKIGEAVALQKRALEACVILLGHEHELTKDMAVCMKTMNELYNKDKIDDDDKPPAKRIAELIPIVDKALQKDDKDDNAPARCDRRVDCWYDSIALWPYCCLYLYAVVVAIVTVVCLARMTSSVRGRKFDLFDRYFIK